MSMLRALVSPLRRFLDWLRDVPVADPVDRRNAPAMQVLFFLLGTSMPVLWIHHLLYAAMPRGGMVSFLTSMVVACAYLASVGMIRYGRFRGAVWLYLASTLLGMEVEYLNAGFLMMGTQHTEPLLALIISGLVMGPRTLWLVFALLQVIAASGYAVDQLRLDDLSVASANLMTSVVTQFTVALILDRTANALRESLHESNQRGRELQAEMQARERLQSQLVHAQKMEAAGRLASGIAHDFGNLLALISGYAAQRDRILGMTRRQEQDAALEEIFSGIETAADQGAALTRKLLSFCRRDASRPEVFDAAAALARMQPLLKQLFLRGVAIELPPDVPPVPVRFDRSEFELMVLNLAANARDAMPAGGAFRIGLGDDDARGRAVLTFSDTGCGMDATTRARIFEPFFSTKGDSGGTGLGLAVIYDMVTAAGGGIEVDSAPGAGTRFTVTLPLARPHGAPPWRPDQPIAAPASST